MQTSPEYATVYSDDLWDYLTDMPTLPSRRDRDRLIEQAKQNTNESRRIRIWDYFFRIKPEEVGKPIRKELTQLENDLTKEQRSAQQKQTQKEAELRQIEAELIQLQPQTDQQIIQAAEQVAKRFAGSTARRRFVGIASITIAALATLLAAWWLFPNIGSQAAFISALRSVTTCCLPIILLFGLVGVFFFVGARSDQRVQNAQFEEQKQRIIQAAEQRHAQLQSRIPQLNQEIQNNQQAFNQRSQQILVRIRFLNGQLGRLIEQIPDTPTVEQIDEWLTDDLEILKEQAVEESGLFGRLASILGSENPICIRGPAELQEKDLIPKQYFDKKSDYSKHFRARRFERIANGKFIDLYGMYSIQYILLGDDVLASYGVIFNFTTGRAIELRTRRQHYADVVGIETRRSSREIEDGEQSLYVEGTPSLRISLTNDEKIDITFPNDDYYRKMADKTFVAAQLEYDPRKAADNANRAVHDKVNTAKKNREIARPDGS